MAKFIQVDGRIGEYQFFCEGCGCNHHVFTKEANQQASWDFNGDINNPTVSPSLLVKWTMTIPEVKNIICHSVITDGMIEYQTDSTHHLAGKKIELKQF